MRVKQNQRTKRAIVDAFLRVLDKKSYDRITIQDILDETPIARSSFYAYFHDKHEIAQYLQKLILDVIDGFGYTLVFFDSPEAETLPPSMPDRFREYRPILSALLKIRTDDVDIMAKLTEGIRKNYIETTRLKDRRFLEVEADMYADIFARFIIYSLTHELKPNSFMRDFRKMYMDVFFRLLTLEEDSEERLREMIEILLKRDHQKFLERESKNERNI